METLSINDQEQRSLDLYIKSHNTAVLTIMFTDIEGYTELTEKHGDMLANEIREKHDDILKNIIENKNTGLIIKFIGDAVMAVFSEPSAAINSAIKIQQAIRTYNQQNDSQPDIRLRIGLHMGQITVEENVHTDIFGRHVNRASRVEGLAQGGQILMSYSVFDSAQGWMIGQKHLNSIKHGYYQLKGISSPVEIFEVFEKNITHPITPSKGRIKTHTLRNTMLIVMFTLIFGVLITFSFQQFKKVEFYVEQFYPENMYFSDKTKLNLAGTSAEPRRLVTNDLESGHHLIYYTVGKNLRYYAEFELKRGKNQLKLKVKEWRLPAIQYRVKKTEINISPYTKTRKLKLLVLNGKTMKSHDVLFTININRTSKNGNISNNVNWQIKHDKKVITKGSNIINQNISDSVVRVPKKTIWESEQFSYILDIYTGKGALNFSIQGKFKK